MNFPNTDYFAVYVGVQFFVKLWWPSVRSNLGVPSPCVPPQHAFSVENKVSLGNNL